MASVIMASAMTTHRRALAAWLTGRRQNLGTDLRSGDPTRTARPANDTWIAACALAYGLPLATLNAKDFKNFAGHDRLNLIMQTH